MDKRRGFTPCIISLWDSGLWCSPVAFFMLMMREAEEMVGNGTLLQPAQSRQHIDPGPNATTAPPMQVCLPAAMPWPPQCNFRKRVLGHSREAKTE